jgi:hypothetical protein
VARPILGGHDASRRRRINEPSKARSGNDPVRPRFGFACPAPKPQRRDEQSGWTVYMGVVRFGRPNRPTKMVLVGSYFDKKNSWFDRLEP